MNPADVLRACPLFAGFTETGLAIVASVCTPRNYPAGTPLFVENMVSDSMFVLARGTVRLTARTDAGEALLGDLGPGEWLGELSIITTGQRMCGAVAMDDVMAVEIRQSDFHRLMAAKPQACIKLLMNVCTHFGQKVTANRDALRSLASRR